MLTEVRSCVCSCAPLSAPPAPCAPLCCPAYVLTEVRCSLPFFCPSLCPYAPSCAPSLCPASCLPHHSLPPVHVLTEVDSPTYVPSVCFLLPLPCCAHPPPLCILHQPQACVLTGVDSLLCVCPPSSPETVRVCSRPAVGAGVPPTDFSRARGLTTNYLTYHSPSCTLPP